MTDLERIKKDVVEMDSRANVCWYDTKVLTKAVRLILEELTADRKTEPQYDFGEYADRLWKIAYERGKREALEQTEPTISKMEQVEDEPQTDCAWK